MLFRRHPYPTALIVRPSPIALPNTARRGSVVCRVHVEMSNGARFSGRISANTPLLKTELSNMSTLVLSRALTPADDGTGTWTITATDSDGQSASINISFTIAAAVAPVFSGWPASVNLPDTAPAGMVVASGTIMNSDGSAFTGTVGVGNAPLTFMP